MAKKNYVAFGACTVGAIAQVQEEAPRTKRNIDKATQPHGPLPGELRYTSSWPCFRFTLLALLFAAQKVV